MKYNLVYKCAYKTMAVMRPMIRAQRKDPDFEGNTPLFSGRYGA